MAEEEKVGTGIEVPKDQESHDDWEPSTAAQEKALTGGWRPKHDWEGEEEDWVDAPEFNRRGELMGRISQLGRKLGDSEKTIEKLTAMVAANEKVTQKMIDQEIEATAGRLKRQRREAIREGDFEAVDEIEDNMDELRKAKAESDKEPAQAPEKSDGPDLSSMSHVQRSWYDFVTGTPWVNQNKDLHDDLLSHAEAYLIDNPEVATGDFMGEVLSKANELRGGKTRTKPRGPDDGKGGSRQKGGARTKASKFSAKDLNAQQRAIAAEFMEDGIIDSLDEYATMMGNEGHLDNQR